MTSQALIRRREGGIPAPGRTMLKGQDERHGLRKRPHPTPPLALGPAVRAFPILDGPPHRFLLPRLDAYDGPSQR